MLRSALLLSLVWLAEAQSQNQSIHQWIHSPRITNWGDWGPSQFCPPGHYAQGIRFKFQKYLGSGPDDAGGTGVKLLCRAPGSTTTTEISSKDAPEGQWYPARFCDGFVVGYRLRVYADHGRGRHHGDNTATSKIQVQCSNGKIVTSDGHDWGPWRDWVHCPKGSVVNGLRTQVSQVQPWHNVDLIDRSGLNNVDMHCCPFRPTCRPADAWREVWRCENFNVEGLTCTYQLKVGISWGSDEATSEATGASYSKTLGMELSASVKGYVELAFRAESSWSKSTSHAWSHSTTQEFSKETTSTITSPAIPIGKVMVVEQVKGTCGLLTISTESFRIRYSDIPSAVF